MNFKLRQHFSIESARFLPNLPEGHPCAKMHGHSFKIILDLVGPINPNLGWVMDYNEIQAVANPILKSIDHQILNNVPGLENPTSELIAKWIYDRLKVKLPSLSQVTVAETPSTECLYPAEA